jgi:hypothetical protein
LKLTTTSHSWQLILLLHGWHELAAKKSLRITTQMPHQAPQINNAYNWEAAIVICTTGVI